MSLYFLCCSVNVSVCLVCCVLDSVCECLVKQFAMCLGVVAVLLLNVMDVFSVGVGALLGDFAYYVVGQEPAIAVHLALWYVVVACHQYDVCKNYVGSVYVGGYGGLSESGLCVSVNCVESAFL